MTAPATPDAPAPQHPETAALTQRPPGQAAIEPLAPPPPDLKLVRGANYPAPEAKEGQKVAWLEQLIAATDADALQRARKTAHNLLHANGRQYVAWNSRQKRFEDLPLDMNERRVTMNYLRPVLRARTRRLLPSKVDFSITPDSSSLDAQDRAIVGQRFFAARWVQLNLRAQVDQALELAYASGVAFLKGFWNPALGIPVKAQLYVPQPVTQQVQDPETGEVIEQPAYDENGMAVTQDVLSYVDEQGQPVEDPSQAFRYRPGDTDVTVRSVFNVRWNPEARGWSSGDGLRWVIDQEPVPIAHARYLFPEYAEKIQPSGVADAYLTYERLAATAPAQSSSTNNATSPGNRPDGDTVMLREYWELPTPHFPGGRLLTVAGQCVVYDGPFPQRIFPFTPIYDEPAALSAGGRASLDDMIAPQMVINEQWGAIMRESKLVGVGQFIALDAPGIPDFVTNEDGVVVKIPLRATAGRNVGDVFQRLDQLQISPDRWRIIQEAQTALFNVGSYHEVTQGQTPPGVDSGVAVRQLVEQEEGQLAKSRDALKESLIDIMRNQLAIAIWGYQPGDERYLPIERPDLGYQIEAVDGQKLPDPETAFITLDGFRATSEAEKRGEVTDAITAGMLSPQEGRRALELGRGLLGTHDTESRHYQRARQINLWIERGEITVEDGGVDEMGQPISTTMSPQGLPVVIPDVDRHELHLEILSELILDESKPPEVRQLANSVFKERLAIVQQRAAMQAQAEQGGPPA